MMFVLDKDFHKHGVYCGITFYPYQWTFGISLRYWPDVYMPSIRIYFLCFKFWFGFKFKDLINKGK